MEQPTPVLNAHNKAEYPPMHTAEHILNGEMSRRYGCGRAFSAHLERKKSKLDYHLPEELSAAQIQDLERYVNEVIEKDMDVTQEFISHEEARHRFDMARLPENTSEMLRVVHVGDVDECLCAGTHVAHTAEIGKFRISSTRWQDGVQRIVFRLDNTE